MNSNRFASLFFFTAASTAGPSGSGAGLFTAPTADPIAYHAESGSPKRGAQTGRNRQGAVSRLLVTELEAQ
jgi:hypothetical protein